MFKVLLIEDNRALSEMGKAMLEENCECEVIVATSRKKPGKYWLTKTIAFFLLLLI